MGVKKELSIIVPVYNVENYLHKCIDSILNQKFKNFELILIDDGSVDSSPAICDEYKARDERVVVIHQENAGACAARRVGIQMAEGRYIGFVDSDDYIEDDMYELLCEKAFAYDADIVACSFFEDGGFITEFKIGLSEGLYKTNEIRKNLFFNLETKKDTVNEILVNKIFRAELIKKFMGSNEFSLRLYADCIMAAHCLIECKSLYVIEKALYHYNKNATQSLTHKRGGGRLIELGKFCQAVEHMRSLPEFTDEVAMQFDMLLTQSIMNEINFGLGLSVSNLLTLDPYYLDEIQEGARLILCGTDGRNDCYRRQIEARGKHKIVGSYDFLSDRERVHNSPQEGAYDYCIITIGNPPIVEYVTQQLMNLGVKREKVLNFEQRKCIFRFLKENNIV